MALIIPTGCADDLTPKVCTSNLIPSETSDGACYQVTINGADDVTIIQGADFDPTDGVVAYDGHGDEIDFSFSPSEIAECEVGKQTIRYSATGYGTRIRPHFPCLRKNKLHISEDCGNDTDTAVVYRTITVEQADPPTISGIDDITVQPNTDFNPLSGVSAVDANGNAVDVEYSGSYDLEATGNPAEFSADASTGIKSLQVALEPIQDLNGYDRPWVGGAGKNLLENTATTTTKQGLAYTVNSDGSVTVNGTATANSYLAIPCDLTFGEAVIVSGTPTPVQSGVYIQTVAGGTNYNDTSGTGQTIPANTQITDVRLRVNNGVTVSNKTFYPMIRLASETDATFEPYSNICPISGHSEVETHRTGRNLLRNRNGQTITLNGITYTPQADGSILVNGTATARSFYYIEQSANGSIGVDELPLGRYTLTGCPSGGSFSGYVLNIYWDGANSNDLGSGATIDIASNSGVRYIRIDMTAGTVCNNLVFRPQLERGASATAYEPYQGETYTTDLGRTVYGGTLDLVSGVLTVDRAMVDLGSLTWTRNTSDYSYAYFYSGGISGYTAGELVCSHYPFATGGKAGLTTDKTVAYYSASSTRIALRDDDYTDATAFKTAMSGVQCVYPLATPQTYQLTPQEVEALVGENVMWSDGDVTVVYSHEMPQGAFQFPVDGEYRITYTAEDKCGNTRTSTRKITVGTFRTVLYTDGTFIINEPSWMTASNTLAHGRATNVYDAFDPNGDTNAKKYRFASDEAVLWHNELARIIRVEIGTRISPTWTTRWFMGCTACTSMDLSNLDTSQVTDIRYMFQRCRSLTEIDVTHFDTHGCTDFDYMFDDCVSLTSLDVSSFNTSNVTTMLCMFQNCSLLTSMDVSNFDVSGTQRLQYLFKGCTNLQTINMDGWRAESITTLQGMFENCSSLRSVDLSGFNTSRVTDMRTMFYNCVALTALDLSMFNTMSALKTQSMFYRCTNLRTIYASDDFVVSQVTDSTYMFDDCTSLVGGSGTAYASSNPNDKTYARIDGGTANPGYFTAR